LHYNARKFTLQLNYLQQAGHVTRKDETHRPRRLTYMKPEGLRKVKIPRARWKDGMQKEARMLGIRRWWATAIN
jgi:hypothetical protein